MLPYDLGQLQLLPDADENYITRQVDRMLYDPQLPNAGDKERKVIKRLEELAEQDWELKAWVHQAINDYRATLPEDPRQAGRYYFCQPFRRSTDKELYELLRSTMRSPDAERRWFARLMLAGLPETVSDFKLDCLFLLRAPDGSVTRLVRLKNIKGEMSKGKNVGDSDVLTPKEFCAPERLREWALGRGNFNWSGNQTALHLLQEDVGRDAAFRVMNQVFCCGWHALRPDAEESRISKEYLVLPGIWFYEDCAFANGELIPPDRDGVVWYREEGYYLNPSGREAEFIQHRPRMYPRLKLKDCDLRIEDWENKPAGNREEDLLRAFFRETCLKFRETVGGWEGALAMGAIFAYAAAPEIFRDFGMFPGLWVHGQAESGKTKFTSWLASLQGFFRQSGISVSGTIVGLMQQAENYSNLLVWIDEFRDNMVDTAKLRILRDAPDRQTQPKWSPDGLLRKINTSYIVSGETTTSDAATRSRYPFIQISKEQRKKGHLWWFEHHKQFFFVFWRAAMERRTEFVRVMMKVLREWVDNPSMATMNDREKMVHGVGYSAFVAMVYLLESHDANELTEFRRCVMEHAVSASADVTSENYVNVFLTDMITAFKAGEIPHTCFRIESERLSHPPGYPNQNGGWTSYRLYIDYNAVLAALQIYLRHGGGNVTLKRKDLRDQLSRERGWIEGKLRKRFGPMKSRTSEACWGILLDEHPMGFQCCPDDVYEHWLLPLGPDMERTDDPRKGPLYTLIAGIERYEKGEE